MSVSIDHATLEDAERLVTTPDEMYRLGLRASTPREGEAGCLVTAHKWFNLAALSGSDEARVYRTQLTLEMTQRQVAEAQRRAREWLARSRAVLAAV
jgi:hypothetical protein